MDTTTNILWGGRNWNSDSNYERELHLRKQSNNIIDHLTPDKNAGVCITGGNAFVKNELFGRLTRLRYKDAYVYEIEPSMLSWYKTSNYIKKAIKKYSKYIFLREIDILSDYQHNITYICNDIQGNSGRTRGLKTYRVFNYNGAAQIVHAFIGKEIKEVGWLFNTSVRPQGIRHYLNLFQQMKNNLAEHRIHCVYETQSPKCYNRQMFIFGGVFRADKRLSNQGLKDIGTNLLSKGYLSNDKKTNS
jgi:hypothetical protein|tara:strand:+ start:68 stop:805 length:738 start_codon:yes stop_codon:yes gene_type:complete